MTKIENILELDGFKQGRSDDDKSKFFQVQPYLFLLLRNTEQIYFQFEPVLRGDLFQLVQLTLVVLNRPFFSELLTNNKN